MSVFLMTSDQTFNYSLCDKYLMDNVDLLDASISKVTHQEIALLRIELCE
jgi:hypothetical protein